MVLARILAVHFFAFLSRYTPWWRDVPLRFVWYGSHNSSTDTPRSAARSASLSSALRLGDRFSLPPFIHLILNSEDDVIVQGRSPLELYDMRQARPEQRSRSRYAAHLARTTAASSSLSKTVSFSGLPLCFTPTCQVRPSVLLFN